MNIFQWNYFSWHLKLLNAIFHCSENHKQNLIHSSWDSDRKPHLSAWLDTTSSIWVDWPFKFLKHAYFNCELMEANNWMCLMLQKKIKSSSNSAPPSNMQGLFLHAINRNIRKMKLILCIVWFRLCFINNICQEASACGRSLMNKDRKWKHCFQQTFPSDRDRKKVYISKDWKQVVWVQWCHWILVLRIKEWLPVRYICDIAPDFICSK